MTMMAVIVVIGTMVRETVVMVMVIMMMLGASEYSDIDVNMGLGTKMMA